MKEFKNYTRTNVAEIREYEEGESLPIHVSISEEDLKYGSPRVGDMIARNPENHNDQWLISKDYFDSNFTELTSGSKSLHNTCANGASKNVKDIVFWGNGDTFKLISKASSEKEGWMKSTKAMNTGVSVVVQVTTQQRNIDGTYSIAEALTTVDGSCIIEKIIDDMCVDRKIIGYSYRDEFLKNNTDWIKIDV